ncbi:hypothetical protein JOD43_003624 [Pullulanibacillus pueri]|uniref:Lipoprotein n=1 Tax=Pullulanibacillus pueri TaxID=1437324 RepID=A0A8J3ENQ3_9BACL|nr:hypothetical protein [Pullulanibacillus pueri]MBM7683444.1 hypothetical protein [Pullulanibacillus pueri]GGH87423.1 hypothetical protein GCM10007096_37410 [Pullulanibacillus pueri]
MKRSLTLLLCLLILFLLSGCSSGNTSKKVDEDSLQNQIILNIQKNGGKKIDFESAMSGFEWDKVYIFTPYSTLKQINKAVGYEWLTHKQGIQFRDDINLVAFVKGNKVVYSVEVPRKYGDFKVSSGKALDKSQSVVNIQPPTNK